MADETTPPQPQDGAQSQTPPKMTVLAQYIRDMSFENVAVQKDLKVDGQPEVQVQVGLDARRKEPAGRFEVILKTKVESKGNGETVFLLELEYAGLFQVENVPDNRLHPYLLIECPRMIFPYLRRVIGDITRDGGFPPLNLDNIDFLQLYQQDLLRRQKAQSDQNGAGVVPQA